MDNIDNLISKALLINLYQTQNCMNAHRIRLVAKEKEVPIENIYVELDDLSEDLLDLNPSSEYPCIIERGMVLRHNKTILEYLDDRFPVPPLLPAEPIIRAQFKQLLFQIERDWYPLVGVVLNSDSEEEIEHAKREIRGNIIKLVPILSNNEYFKGDSFSLLDVSLGVLLWRLPELDIELPNSAKPVIDYMNRIFDKPAFRDSLSDYELNIRDQL